MADFVWSSHLLQSESINGRRVYRMVLPEGFDAVATTNHRIPLLILLHGVHGSENDWVDMGWLIQALNRLLANGEIKPMAVLTPSDGLTGIGTGYLNWAEHDSHRYEDYLLKDLLEEVERKWLVGGSREKRAISGLSMGGYASIRLALHYPDRFVSASGMSSFLDVLELRRLVGDITFGRIFAAGAEQLAEASPLYRKLDRATVYPFLKFDCGTSDAYIGQNRQFQLRLTETGIPHEFAEKPGGHTWDYWRESLDEHLRFHSRHLYHLQGGVF